MLFENIRKEFGGDGSKDDAGGKVLNASTNDGGWSPEDREDTAADSRNNRDYEVEKCLLEAIGHGDIPSLILFTSCTEGADELCQVSRSAHQGFTSTTAFAVPL
ncbi:MAG: hypothetical protein KatS3mg057_0141 [Herpetosiphonaceae bacterium]|nr:MAG: hypothetical protein KatS3mg057_0141 [Herpetosiphonaceae bacterium]